jgi:methionine salvage enolase-phosphatase E1
MPDYLTVIDVREDMLDRMAEDHLVLADLAFTDEDIEWAMKTCARKFNSVKPMISSAEWDKLPLNSSVFSDGVAWALIRRWHRNVSMNDYNYSAGGVEANVQGSLLRNLEKLRDKLEQEFIQYATDLKVAINLEGAYGPIG